MELSTIINPLAVSASWIFYQTEHFCWILDIPRWLQLAGSFSTFSWICSSRVRNELKISCLHLDTAQYCHFCWINWILMWPWTVSITILIFILSIFMQIVDHWVDFKRFWLFLSTIRPSMTVELDMWDTAQKFCSVHLTFWCVHWCRTWAIFFRMASWRQLWSVLKGLK